MRTGFLTAALLALAVGVTPQLALADSPAEAKKEMMEEKAEKQKEMKEKKEEAAKERAEAAQDALD